MTTSLLKLPCSANQIDTFLSRPSQALIDALQRIRGDFQILGAGGKMGLHLCRMLRSALDAKKDTRRVIAVSRFGSVHAREEFERFGIETRACDLSDAASLATLEDIENIIFMAGAKFGTANNPGLLNQMNVEMPKLVAARFKNARITAFSTGCVYSFVPTDSNGATESAETNPIGAYAQSCLGREQSFRTASKQYHTPLALIRLNYSVEFRYGVLVDLAEKVRNEEPIDVTTGHVNLIWQRDAVEQIILSHEYANTEPFIINITGPKVYHVRDLAKKFGQLFGKTPLFTGEEAKTAWISDASYSHKLFGKPETSLEEMMIWVAAWLDQGNATLGKPTGFEKRDGKF